MKNFLRKVFFSKEIEGEQGIALFTALSFVTIFSLLAGGFVAVGVRNSHLEADFQHTSNALSSAEAGIHFAIGQMYSGEIVPPEPIEGDEEWENWLDSLETPGYGSDVEVSYATNLMDTLFRPDGTMADENKYFRIHSVGSGPRQTKRTIEVITNLEGITPNLKYAFYFGSNATFNGNPVTFSGHHDSLTVELDNNGKPFFDVDGDGDFDQDDEWGWAHGVHELDSLRLSSPAPESANFSPDLPGLHSRGDIHANGNITLASNPRFNGYGSATGQIQRPNGDPFQNEDKKFIRHGYTNNAPPVPFGDEIPTDLTTWEKIAEHDTSVHIITPENVGEYPGWQYVGGKFKWSGNNPMSKRTYYLTDDVEIKGNATGNATIVTDYTIKVDGNVLNYAAKALMGYVAGGNITITGGQYIQGLVYSKSNINFPGQSYIFGAIWTKGTGSINGSPIVVFNDALKEARFSWNLKHAIVSWQEIYQ